MKKVLQSGAEIDVTMCSFSVGTRLLKAIAFEISRVDMNILGPNGKLEDLLNMEIGDDLLNTAKNMITTLMASDRIEEALWACMEKATYKSNGSERKITREIFEEESVREDYLAIAQEVLWFNLRPFLKSLNSSLTGLKSRISNTQKLK